MAEKRIVRNYFRRKLGRAVQMAPSKQPANREGLARARREPAAAIPAGSNWDHDTAQAAKRVG